jgi:hypothetical protein
MADITALILTDHEWFREQFAKLGALQTRTPGSRAALERVWRPLADKLDVHAYIEGENFLSATTHAGCRRPRGGDARRDR